MYAEDVVEKVQDLLVEAHASAKVSIYDESWIKYFDGQIHAYEKILQFIKEENK
ncbi:hypothetical protein P4H82_26980 [Bacillus cereus]|uniref:Uncharacterized protein n=1 Tax=Bacillus phage B5S TaxID=1126949 RepID=J9Q9W9_9CAUD|nr:hypothetical protein QLX26_gp227 [Bacillus phage B5S]AEW47461.1 hypothetical protein B5S_0227 [Bacillus phage B5S]MEB9013814.1 hypothetical protein [Bacillus cereus]MEB9190571.1 hypothetical protein [Bacillus cereus]